MSWGANAIFIAATERAVAWAAQSPLAHVAYVVRRLPDHAWYRREWKHDVGAEGLLVLRPVGHPNAYGMNNGVVWNTLIPDRFTTPDTVVSAQLHAYLAELGMEEECPPADFRRWLQSVAAELGQSIVFYSCSMWAGDIEHEYVLGYGAGERLHVTRQDAAGQMIGHDALRKGLAEVSVHLPTGYFALHTGGFDWASHALMKG